MDIYRIPAGGGAQVKVTDTPEIAEFSPTYSPDGQYIAYERYDPNHPNWDIYYIAVNGGSPIRLTSNASTEWAPSWSPDGSRIAFTSNRNGNSGDIYVLYLDAANVEPSSLGKIKALFR